MIDWLREPRDPMVALAGGDLPLIVRRHPLEDVDGKDADGNDYSERE